MRKCDCGPDLRVFSPAIGWGLVCFGIGLLSSWFWLIGCKALKESLPQCLGLLRFLRRANDDVREMVTEDSEDSLSEEEAKVYARRRFETVQAAIFYFSLVFVPLSSIMLIAAPLVNRPLGTYWVSTFTSNLMTELVTSCVFFTAVIFFKTKISLRFVEVFLLVLFQGLGVHGFLCTDNYMFVADYHRLAILAQMAVSQLLASPRLILIPNIINLLLQLTVLAISPALRPNLAQHVVAISISFILNFAASAGASAGLRAESRALVAGRKASVGEATAMSLLSAMCDSVVKLRPNLSLDGSFPKLNAMLLRAKAQPKEEIYFDKLLCSEDADRFRDFIQKQSATPTKAAALHLHLVDSLQNKVPVRIFHTCTIGLDGKLSHMVGINDDSQENRDDFPANSAMPAASADQANPAWQAQHWQDFARILPAAMERQDSHHSSQSSGENPLDLTVTLRASLSCQVIGESDTSSVVFGFLGDSQLAFLQRFNEWRKLLLALEIMHAESAAGSEVSEQSLWEVTVSNRAAQTTLKHNLVIRHIPRAKEQGVPQRELSYSDFELVFKKRKRPKHSLHLTNRGEETKRLQQRADRACASANQVPSLEED